MFASRGPVSDVDRRYQRRDQSGTARQACCLTELEAFKDDREEIIGHQFVQNSSMAHWSYRGAVGCVAVVVQAEVDLDVVVRDDRPLGLAILDELHDIVSGELL